MKFHWFGEVTYPFLPKDFPEKYPSAWVDPPFHTADPLKVGETYHMYLDLMEQADGLGFDGLLVNEHHQTPFAMSPSPNLLAASLARNSKNAAIVIVGDSLALYNPPTRIAEEMAYLDCLSGGRLIAGFVYGTPMDSVYSYGTPPPEVRERFAEARELIVRSWQEEEPFAFNGKYTKLRYINPWPRPVQKPNPPIWVPGSGSLETWDLVMEHDYCYGHLSFSGMWSAKPIVDGYWDYVDKHNGNMNPNKMAFTQICCVADTDAEAAELYEDAVKYFYKYNKVSPAFFNAPGYRSAKSMRWEMERATNNPDRARAANGEMSFSEYNDKGYIVAGSPATVRERIREIAKDLRVGQLIPTLHMGNLSHEQAARNTELFGTQVIPHLRDVWADWEDNWTPKVSQERVAAAEKARIAAEQPAGVAGGAA